MSYITHPNDFNNHLLKLYCEDKTLFDKNTVFKKDSFGLKIKYKYDNEYINVLNFTLFENNLKWNKLSTGFIKTDIFTNNLKMDIILNENILIDFIHILERYLKTVLLENKSLNKYIINIKETIVKKNNAFYFNNIKFNYFIKNNDKKIISKIYIKKNQDGIINTVLMTEEEIEQCINTGFYILPVVSLKTLYIKRQNKTLNVYPHFYLYSVTLYNKYKQDINDSILDKKCNIDEDGY
jgi:hypothetical protein